MSDGGPLSPLPAVFWRLLADLVFVLHFAFIVWATLGALSVLYRRRLAWLHLPALAWGATVEFAGLICPLTPLEVRLQRAAGEAGYTGDFITHYLVPVMYPAHLTRGVQLTLGALLVLLNVVLYTLVWRRAMASRGRAR